MDLGASGDRTRDLFEQVEGYRQAPLVALPDESDPDVLRQFGLKEGRLSRAVFHTGFRLAGWNRFVRSLQNNLDTALRTTDTRVLFFPPAISATLAFKDDPRPLTPWQRAASLILGARSLYDDLCVAALPQDEHRGAPLDMGQYPNFFSTSMTVEGDRLRRYKSRDASRIALVSGGEIDLLDLWEGGRKPEPSALAATLEALSTGGGGEGGALSKTSIGLLTAAWDDRQVRFFNALARTAPNSASLNAMRDVAFTVCLDMESEPASAMEAARLAHIGNPANRWYHSSFQIVVFGNGRAAAICSFRAWLDGNAMGRGAAEIYRRAAAVEFTGSSKYRCVGVKTAMVTVADVVQCVERLAAMGERDDASLLLELGRAVKAEERECSLARRSLSIEDVRALFHHSQKGIRGRVSAMIEKWTLALLRRLDLYREPHRDILLSHPAIHPEVPILGRPGVRLPYVRYFALHYAIDANEITCTLAKGSEWNVPNRRFVEELETALWQLSDLLESAKPGRDRKTGS